MKKPTSKITLLACLFAVAGMFTVPAVRAADDAEKAAKKKAKEAADLKKYDKNGNGKLDPDEKAALDADVAKAKAEKKKKAEEKK
ncbi:MAG: hypothetical protein HZA93_01340 [Verrucomicrobia bacterium]|nr:hypothetical protein [Verrucomicrobiota bacterium]